jgi:hypothetical protein
VVTQESAVNEQLTPGRQAKKTTLVGGVRVETTIKELKAVKGQQVYEKRITTSQHELGKDAGDRSYDELDRAAGGDEDDGHKKLGGLAVLKNFVDNIAADIRQFRTEVSNDRIAQWVMIAACGIIGVAALVIALLR